MDALESEDGASGERERGTPSPDEKDDPFRR
jgi:hypothetical protein